MQKINSRQIIIFYFIYTAAVKFLMLPHYLSESAGRDGWISALLGSLLELLLLFAVVKSIELRNSDGNIYTQLRRRTTAVGAKLIIGIWLLFFLLQSLIIIKQTGFLLEQSLYEELSVLKYAVPILVLGIAFCYMPVRSIFRSGEIFYVLIAAALGLSLLPALGKADPAEILPVLEGGARPVLEGVYNNLIYFESSAILLMFAGDIKVQKTFTRTFMFWAIIGAIVFTAFVFLYYSMFGPLTVVRPLSIVNITQQSSYIVQNGRLEWIIVCIWLILLLMRFGVTFLACFAAIRYIIGIKTRPVAVVLPLAAVLYIVHTYIIISLADLGRFITALLPVIAGFYLLVLVIAILLSFNRNKKQEVNRDV